MRLRKPKSKTFALISNILERLLLIITSPAWLSFIAIFGAIFGVQWLKRKVFGPRQGWEVWFAWHPVRINDDTFGPLHWLEPVERRSWDAHSSIQYRFIGDDNSHWDRARRQAEKDDAERKAYWASRKRPTPTGDS